MKPIVGLLAVVVALAMAIVPVPVWAEDPPPPAVGAIILEDDLLEPTLIRPFTCRTQRGGIDFVGEGLRMKLAGACNDGEIFAGTGANLRGLTIADGEVRVDIKPVSGVPLVRFNINVRGQPFTPGALNSVETVPASYAVAVEPGHGRVLIGKVGTRIIERSDLAEMIPGG